MATAEKSIPRAKVLDDGTVMIFGVIGDEWDGLNAEQLVSELRGMRGQETINILLNSPGGYVYEGLAIYHELKTSPAKVEIEIVGIAASMASAIAMAGDTVKIAANGHIMIHNPWNVAVGNAEDLRKAADLLDQLGKSLVDIYVEKTGLDRKEIERMMDEETWLSADEAKQKGFVDEIIGSASPEDFAVLDLSEVNKVPAALTKLIREGRRMAAKAKLETTPSNTPAPAPAPAPVAAAEPVPTPAPVAALTDASVQTAVDAALDRREQRARERAEAIRAMATKAGLQESWANARIASTDTVEEARANLVDTLVSGQNDGIQAHVRIGTDERDKWLAGSDPDMRLKQRPEAGEFRGFSLLDIARDSLDRDGVRTRGMSTDEVARQIFAPRGANRGLGTRSDFPILLENVLHKLLQAAYETSPDQWRAFCATGAVQDFRPHPRLRLGSLARLSDKLESGEFRQAHFPDAEKESIQAATFGNIIGLTREAIVNDDVDGFTRMTAMLGRAAARSIEIDVFALLALNSGAGPNMSDSQPLFHTTHGNVEGTITGPPSVETLEACRVLMALQKDPADNDFLNLRPHVWVGPIGLGAAARVAVQAEFDFAATEQFMKPNAVRDLVKQFVDTPRLSGDPWYLFADPAIAPCIEVAFLQGQESPQIRTEEGFDYDGIRWRVLFDYGVGATDFRGAVRNDGDTEGG
jgi:ATP-dependent Clp endopeptidase proteolytic subunit ClpP